MMKISNIKYQISKVHTKIQSATILGGWIVILIFTFCILDFNCYAQMVSSSELIENAKFYDGKEIVFQGEVIGDVMKRGDSSWVNINDEQNSVGIFFENSISYDIKFTGDYDHMGDIVEISGIFHRACLEHGGDMDIHAAGIVKLEDGYKVIHKVDNKKLKAILWLSIILVIFTMGAVIKR